MTDFIVGLTDERVFNVFIPDITLEEARKNDPYVLRVTVPVGSSLLDVLQISSPLAGLGALAGTAQTAYAFLCNPREPDTCNVYITAVFSERPFPWHAVAEGQESSVAAVRYAKGGLAYLEYTQEAFCSPVGITTHNGVPLLHVRIDVHCDAYASFEADLSSAGYRIVPAKAYVQAEPLIALLKAQRPATEAASSSAQKNG